MSATSLPVEPKTFLKAKSISTSIPIVFRISEHSFVSNLSLKTFKQKSNRRTTSIRVASVSDYQSHAFSSAFSAPRRFHVFQITATSEAPAANNGIAGGTETQRRRGRRAGGSYPSRPPKMLYRAVSKQPAKDLHFLFASGPGILSVLR